MSVFWLTILICFCVLDAAIIVPLSISRRKRKREREGERNERP